MTSSRHGLRRVSERWWLLAVAVLALRLPLWSLPALGRDEALYLYWSRHLEWAYAPLLQLLLRTVSVGGEPPAWVWRLPTILVGLLLLGIFHELLRRRGLGSTGRFLAVAGLALSPWQTHTASVIHPDSLLVAALLGLALLDPRHRPLAVALLASLAFWAKPSGGLAVLVALIALVGTTIQGATPARRGRTALAILGLLALSAVPLAHWNGAMVDALRQFGRVPESTSTLTRAGQALLGLCIVGGPLLLLALGRGAAETLRQRRWDLGSGLGGAYLLAFAGAAIVLGQIKANWMLPAALLLWPAGLDPRGKAARLAGSGGVLLSMAVCVAFAAPELVRELESRSLPAPLQYARLAGEREAKVAPARQWWERLSVYQGLDSMPDEILTAIPRGERLVAIRSDDYGLSAQLAAALKKRRPSWDLHLVLPVDPLYASMPGPRQEGLTLVLPVQVALETLVSVPDEVFEVEHPIDGRRLRLGLVRTAPATETSLPED